MLTYGLKSKHCHLYNTGNFKPFMVDGKSKMYAYNDLWYQNVLQHNKIKLLEYDPHILFMILTCIKGAHHI